MADKAKVKVYTVRIDYDCGMERMDVTAKDTVSALANTAKLIALKQKLRGIHNQVKAVTIEHD